MKNIFIVLLLLALLIWGSPVPVRAQTQVTVNLQTAEFSWTWTPDPQSGTLGEFHLYCGPASNPTGPPIIIPPAARSYPLRLAVPSSGLYFCAIAAANSFGEAARSNEVNFVAGVSPSGSISLAIQGN